MLDPNNIFIPSGTEAAATESNSLFGLDPYQLLAGFIFSTIGLGAWYYGKKLERWKPMVIGMAMMIYPYFIYNRIAVWMVGIVLTVLLWFNHYE